MFLASLSASFFRFVYEIMKTRLVLTDRQIQWLLTHKNLSSLIKRFNDCSCLFKIVPRDCFQRVPMPNSYESLFVVPFTVFWVSKRHLSITLFYTKASKEHDTEFPEPTLSRPCFSRNHSNYRAFGTSWFF